jgi:hypothetical protein
LVLAVLLGLRVLIGMGAAVFVWFSMVLLIGAPVSMVSILAPVWLGGLTGGVVCSLFSLRQGLSMAGVCGILLMIGFIWVRHGMLGMPMGENTFVTLWPVWFPPSFYVGAFSYMQFMRLKI